MKLKRLTLFAFVLMSAIAFSISGCKKDKDGDNGGGGGGTQPDPNAPVISLYTTGAGGDLYWVYKNRTEPVGTKLRFGIEVKCPTEIATVTVTRKAISGPQNGVLIPLWDTTLNETITTKTMIRELLTDGVLATQTVVFTFKATAKNGLSHEISVEISPDVAVGLREMQSLFDRDENGAFDLVQAVSISKANEPARHDIKLSKSGSSFKLVSGNGSKFKAFKGTTFFPGFVNKATLDAAWNSSGTEMNESPLLDEDPDPSVYKLILVKSAQNNAIFVLDVYEIYDDEIVFDYRGEGI